MFCGFEATSSRAQADTMLLTAGPYLRSGGGSASWGGAAALGGQLAGGGKAANCRDAWLRRCTFDEEGRLGGRRAAPWPSAVRIFL